MSKFSPRLCGLIPLLIACSAAFGQSKQFFPMNQVPQFNILRMKSPPEIDGTITGDEWETSVRVMGMATAHSDFFRERPHVFWVAWDEQHIYIAGRAHVLKGRTIFPALSALRR